MFYTTSDRCTRNQPYLSTFRGESDASQAYQELSPWVEALTEKVPQASVGPFPTGWPKRKYIYRGTYDVAR